MFGHDGRETPRGKQILARKVSIKLLDPMQIIRGVAQKKQLNGIFLRELFYFLFVVYFFYSWQSSISKTVDLNKKFVDVNF